jgi:hypothetical protein
MAIFDTDIKKAKTTHRTGSYQTNKSKQIKPELDLKNKYDSLKNA